MTLVHREPHREILVLREEDTGTERGRYLNIELGTIPVHCTVYRYSKDNFTGYDTGAEMGRYWNREKRWILVQIKRDTV
jgi:hypothetical protein